MGSICVVGGKVAKKALSITDSFDRADSALGGSTTSDGKAVWSASANWTIVTNRVRHLSTQAHEYALVDHGATDGSYSVALGSVLSQSIGLAILSDATAANCYHLVVDVGDPNKRYSVHKRAGGSASVVQGGLGSTAAAGDVLKATVTGTTVEFFVNGVSIFSITSATLAGTYAGMRVYSSDGIEVFFDNYGPVTV